jgi:hypothetical protein
MSIMSTSKKFGFSAGGVVTETSDPHRPVSLEIWKDTAWAASLRDKMNEMRILQEVVSFGIIEVIGVLVPMHLGREGTVDGPPLQERINIRPSRLAIGYQISPIIEPRDAPAPPNGAGVQRVEVLMRNADSVMDHSPAQQPASGARGRADEDFGANGPRFPVEPLFPKFQFAEARCLHSFLIQVLEVLAPSAPYLEF